MIKYVGASLALKAFSLNAQTRQLYRSLGNTRGAQKRLQQVPPHYIDRVNQMLARHAELGVPADDQRILEFGTGWLHWEALTARIFFDCPAVLYDVWDNRQFDALKHNLGQLRHRIDDFQIAPERRERAKAIIDKVLSTNDFDELYRLLDFEYHLDPEGRLERIETGRFDLVVSGGVMEHVDRDDAGAIVAGIARVLKPGGLSVHSINIRDHLYQYDRSVCAKQYLAYSDRTWRRWFENGVQYINRIQKSEWLAMFEAAGLELVHEKVDEVDLRGIRVSGRFASYDESDLRCGGLIVVHRKRK